MEEGEEDNEDVEASLEDDAEEDEDVDDAAAFDEVEADESTEQKEAVCCLCGDKKIMFSTGGNCRDCKHGVMQKVRPVQKCRNKHNGGWPGSQTCATKCKKYFPC